MRTTVEKGFVQGHTGGDALLVSQSRVRRAGVRLIRTSRSEPALIGTRRARPWLAPLCVSLIAALLVSSFVFIRLAVVGGPSGFVLAGDLMSDASATPSELKVLEGSTGYDGQYLYRLSLNPFTNSVVEHGITLDRPSYRHQRIGLPLVVWGLSKATGLSAMWVLILVNSVAVAVAAACGAVLARHLGRHPMWGLLLALTPGVIIGLARDLTEPLAWCFVLAGLCAWGRKRAGLAATLFTMAVLTRETAILVPAALGALWVIRWIRGRTWPEAWGPGLAMTAVGAVWLAWQSVLSAVWGPNPVASAADASFGVPFVSVLGSLFGGAIPRGMTGMSQPLLAIWTGERLIFLLVLCAAAFGLHRSRLETGARLAWLFTFLMVMSLSGWAWDAQFFRAGNEAWGLSILVLLGTSKRLTLEVAAGMSFLVALLYAMSL